MKFLVILAFCTATSAGVVEHARCGMYFLIVITHWSLNVTLFSFLGGGVGTILQIRMQNTEGPIGYVPPGVPCLCEGDVVFSTAALELRLRLTVTNTGTPINLIDTVFPGVQPGVPYTIRLNITPNDTFAGLILPYRATVDNRNGLTEICAQVQVMVTNW